MRKKQSNGATPEEVCQGKRAFSKREAETYVNWKHDPRETYQCRVCNFWHLSSSLTVAPKSRPKPQPRRLLRDQEAE